MKPAQTISIQAAPSLFVMLFVLFLGLKLCDVIDWSWWWVFAPLWGPMVLSLVLVAVYVWALRS